MSRRIVTTQLQSSRDSAWVDTYFDKVVKYIPADIIGAWVAVTGIVNGASEHDSRTALLWIAFALFVVLTGLWTWKQTEESGKPAAKRQIGISTTAFGVWVFALGGPFVSLSWYDPVYGSFLLIVYTLFVGIINPPE